jgi:hypothetical protein
MSRTHNQGGCHSSPDRHLCVFVCVCVCLCVCVCVFNKRKHAYSTSTPARADMKYRTPIPFFPHKSCFNIICIRTQSESDRFVNSDVNCDIVHRYWHQRLFTSCSVFPQRTPVIDCWLRFSSLNVGTTLRSVIVRWMLGDVLLANKIHLARPHCSPWRKNLLCQSFSLHECS